MMAISRSSAMEGIAIYRLSAQSRAEAGFNA
jgi:hypothetical protein